MDGKLCVVVLIGANTAGRRWINHEIVKGWNDRKGVVGIYVHNLLNSNQEQLAKGANPFASIKYGDSGKMLSSIVKAYDPPYLNRKNIYDHISVNLTDWAEETIGISVTHRV